MSYRFEPPDEAEDETTCDACGNACRRLVPLAETELCDACWRQTEQRADIFQAGIRSFFQRTEPEPK